MFRNLFNKEDASRRRMDSERALFINGQVVKGNLKPKRVRRQTEISRRLESRAEVNKLLGEDIGGDRSGDTAGDTGVDLGEKE